MNRKIIGEAIYVRVSDRKLPLKTLQSAFFFHRVRVAQSQRLKEYNTMSFI
jgi:hypothetical protein